MRTNLVKIAAVAATKAVNALVKDQADSAKLFPLLLEQIEATVRSVHLWHENVEWSDRTFSNIQQLIALVELLEVFDCGSTGGFGKNQGYGSQTLLERADWLLNKYRPRPAINKVS